MAQILSQNFKDQNNNDQNNNQESNDVLRKNDENAEDTENNKNNNNSSNNANGNSNNTSTADMGSKSVTLTKQINFSTPGLSNLIDATKYLARGIEKGIINEKTGSDIVIRQNGQVNLVSNRYTQYKLNPSGKAVEESLESVTITNRKKFSADDIIVNEHKMNPFVYELTDMKELSNVYNNKMLVGNFTMFGTVLVKAWEPELKRYVLIRRLARMPLFSPLLNAPEIHAGLNISDPLKVDHKILAKSEKGYQVNKPLKDRNSLIGKEGVDRAGINRNPGLAISETPTTLGASGAAIGNVSMNPDAGNLDIRTVHAKFTINAIYQAASRRENSSWMTPKHIETMVNIAEKAGINPVFFCSSMILEGGSELNPGNVENYGSGERFGGFSSFEKAIEESVGAWKQEIHRAGTGNMWKVANIYAPQGEGENRNYVPNVCSIMNEIYGSNLVTAGSNPIAPGENSWKYSDDEPSPSDYNAKRGKT